MPEAFAPFDGKCHVQSGLQALPAGNGVSMHASTVPHNFLCTLV